MGFDGTYFTLSRIQHFLQSTLVKEYDIKTTEARLRAETDNIAVVQSNQAIISLAQAKLDSARIEAEALLIAANARRKVEEIQGSIYSQYPLLFDLEISKIKAEALSRATIYLTPKDMGNFFNAPVEIFNSFAVPPVPETPETDIKL